MEIVILDKKTLTINDISLKEIEVLGHVTAYDLTPPEKIIERIGDAEAVLCNKSPLTNEVLNGCKNLKYIGLFATGYNNVDIEAANKRGITVSNAGEYSTLAVAQHVFALIMQFSSSISLYNSAVKKGDWITSHTFSFFDYPTFELSGLTLGIVGFGSIGKAVAKIADAFGMKVIVSTRTIPINAVYPYQFVTMDELLTRSDIITLHCPLTSDTQGLICEETLSKMKESAILINTSRGGVVVEQDLANALNNGLIAGAGIDVVAVEPMSATNPLKDAKNCVITPHIAWAPKQTRERLVSIVADNLRGYQNGKPKNVVN